MYTLYVEKHNFFEGVLQLILRLEGKDSGSLNFILEEFEIDSEAFYRFLRYVYPLEFCNIVEFDENDLDRFICYVKVKKDGHHFFVDWDSMSAFSTPISAMRELYHEIDPEKYF